MRVNAVIGAISVLMSVVWAGSPAEAATLDDRKFEWTFDANYLDQHGGATTTDARFAWGYLVGGGYSEWGVSGSYFKLEDEDASDSTQTFTSGGPFYTWNWTPKADRATGFVTVSVGALGGDVSQSQDYSVEGSIGVKLFVNDSVAVTARYFARSFQYLDTYGTTYHFEGLSIGIALFSGRKH